jgi:hypothetical protein
MTAKDPTDLLQAEADFVASAVELQAQALSLLLAEMRALSDVLPGAIPGTNPASTLVGMPRPDTEIESDFDNLPV